MAEIVYERRSRPRSIDETNYTGGNAAGDLCRDCRPNPAAELEMRNVRLHVADGIVLDIARLRGVMTSRTGAAPVFDDQESYTLHLRSGEIAMDMASLRTLLNRHVFAYRGSPLKDLSVGVNGSR